MIKANVHDDDERFSINFDATLWFEDASDGSIKELAKYDWGYDYTADAVAQYMVIHDDQVNNFFDYIEALAVLSGASSAGFECYVNTEDAIVWIKANRPHLLEKIKESSNEDNDTKRWR